jgi:hypothetical protein
MAIPIIEVLNINSTKLSDETGKDVCEVQIACTNTSIDKFEVRAVKSGGSIGRGRGLIVEIDGALYPSEVSYPNDNLFPKDYNLAPLSDLNNNSGLSSSLAYSAPWDTTKNPYGIYASGWSSGYNGGVQVPNLGYHAHLRPNYGPNSENVFEYIDLNSDIGYPHRWLGISKGLSSNALNSGWMIGTEIEITVDIKTDVPGKYSQIGLYHKDRNTGSNTFGSQITSFTPSSVNKWETITKKFTIDSSWKLDDFCSIYMYGHHGPEGTIWIANPKIIIGKQTIVIDDEELSQGDGSYTISVYGRSTGGEWNE